MFIWKQVVGIPMGTNCAPLTAEFFLYCYESQFMAKLCKDTLLLHLVDIVFNTYRYLDDFFRYIIQSSYNLLPHSERTELLDNNWSKDEWILQTKDFL